MAGAGLVTGTGEWKSALTRDALQAPPEDLADDEALYHLNDLIERADASVVWTCCVLKTLEDWIWKKARRHTESV